LRAVWFPDATARRVSGRAPASDAKELGRRLAEKLKHHE
jgi:hypothetical protein